MARAMPTLGYMVFFFSSLQTEHRNKEDSACAGCGIANPV